MAVKSTTRPAAQPGKRAAASKPTTTRALVKRLQSPEQHESNIPRDLRILRAILEPPLKANVTKTQARRPKTASSTASSRATTAKPATQNGTSGNGISEAEVPSNPQEQKKLAMNSFNENLKVLSAVVKKRQERKLQEELERKKRAATVVVFETTLEDGSELVSRAECACAALDVLRLHDMDDAVLNESRKKREQGAVLLVEKLITLDMQTLAHSELSKIHEQYWKRRKSTTKARTGSKTPLAELLRVDAIPADKHAFDFTCSFQSQILRLAILIGAETFSQDLLDGMKLELAGSPGNVILTGHKANHVESRKAGENLRTVAQALTKFYAALVKWMGSDSNILDGALQLLVEAQVYKLASWSILGCTPDLKNEVWMVVDRALRHTWKGQPSKHKERYDTTTILLVRLQDQLEAHGHDSELPRTLSELLANLAQSNGDAKRAIDLLQGLVSSARGLEKLVHLCQLASIQLSYSDSENKANEAVKEVVEAFSHSEHWDMRLTAEQLLHVIHIRKACSQKLSIPPTTRDEDAALGNNCLKLMFGILKFLDAASKAQSTADDKLGRAVRLAEIKTIEAAVDVEKYVLATSQPMLADYLNDLDPCVKMLTDIACAQDTREDSVTTVPHSLRFRLSNIFWRAHLHPQIADQGTDAVLPFAQKSILCLHDLPQEELSKAALGPRLEKLANLRLNVGQADGGRATLKQAIAHYIEVGALSDAVEASLSKRSEAVWSDSSSISYQLGRALHTYNASFDLEDELRDLHEHIYDDTNLADVHRAILLEHQTIYLLKKRPEETVYQTLFSYARLILELTASPQYHIWKMRFASAFTYRASSIPNLPEENSMKLCELLQAVLVGTGESSNAFLRSYQPVMQAMLRLQTCLLRIGGYKFDLDDIEAELQKVEAVITNCADVDALHEVADDYERFDALLEAFANQSAALRYDELASLCLRSRAQILALKPNRSQTQLVNCLLQLASCQIRIDDHVSASKSLLTIEQTISVSSGEEFDHTRYHLVLAELQLASNSLSRCRDHLQQAGHAFSEQWLAESAMSRSKQLERDSIVAEAAHIASRLAFEEGRPILAYRHARQGAKIAMSIWAALQKRRMTKPVPNDDSTVMSLAEDVSKLNIGSQAQHMQPCVDGPKLWPYVQIYHTNLRHAAAMLDHAGIFEDALHFHQQLKSLSVSLPQRNGSLGDVSAMLTLQARAGQIAEANVLLITLAWEESQYHRPGHLAALLSYAEACALLGSTDRSIDTTKVIAQLSVSPSIAGKHDLNQNAKPRTVTNARGGPTKPKMAKVLARRQKNAVTNMAPEKSVGSQQQVVTQSIRPSQNNIDDRYRALLRLLPVAGFDLEATGFQSTISELCASPKHLTREMFAVAKTTLTKAWQILCQDSLQSVLADSAVALPAKVVKGRRGRVSFLQGGGDNIVLSPSKHLIEHTDSPRPADLHQVARMLQTALVLCKSLLIERKQFCSTDMIHTLMRMEARISLLLTTMNLPFAISSSELVLKASQPKDEALERERMVAAAEEATRERSKLSMWPSELDSPASTSTITAKQLSQLPSSWSIVSVTLTEDEDELLISRVVSGRSPFLVRIPLRRSNEGEGIEEFLFADAKAEMQDIIKNADSSSHDIRGMGDKAARMQWHADREALDKRLETLLQNMESIWLGGFRGVLSPTAFTESEIKEFGKALTRSLDNHLPSRQKSGTIERVEIHDHVLETFLGLGHPDQIGLDDSIIDLLYFVVDICQFNGEKNAYDEIDWDSMLVDVLDALKACHEARTTQPPRHTILVLDKELECFPWECMPCFINHPVSRMPSLAMIIDRLDQIRLQSEVSDALSISTSTARGTIILNPSSDLKSTQDLFEPILTSQPTTSNFTSLIKTTPTESQFSTLLSTSDLLLYFGHGSGAQYIRPRVIRSLFRCAVTLLFGCSSAKMTEHGAFESTGMPRAYMLGGSAAVVGCLWDVTDREIDRVALKALSEWGLVDGEDERVREGLRRKGRKGKDKARQKKEDVGGGKKKKTLIEAVRDGREACVLKYLCGAAVVVYGVPVVLD